MSIEYLTLKEASKILGTSKAKLTRLVKDGILKVYTDPLDKRKKLVRREDVEKLKHPQPKRG